MPETVVTTLTLKESGEKEEELNEAITDVGFVPEAPVAGAISEYEAGATYAKGALAQEKGVVYRSQAAANKGNTPHEDADFTHWAPTSVATYPVQGSAAYATAVRTEPGFNEPPARSDAAALPAETINEGSQIGLGV